MLGWFGIVRLGLVQTALGSVVVLTTSTLNRVMVVELALAAAIPALLVGVYYSVQILRPLWGHGSDIGGRRTPWIIGGVALMGLGATGAAVAVAVMAHSFALGLVLAVVDFLLIGIGIGAAGTSLLALLAASVAPERRPAAASIVWLMMIAGMALNAIAIGAVLDPFSAPRLVAVTAASCAAALLLTLAAVWRIEPRAAAVRPERERTSFRDSLADAWSDPRARRFTIFVFVSMLAYSAQDLILEPFAGLVFAMTPGETTTLAGYQHGGVFVGMLTTGLVATLLSRRWSGALRVFVVAGCVLSGLALLGLATAATRPQGWPLEANVVFLGFANGMFAVAAIGAMMALAGAAGEGRTGMRMGLWGAAQAIAFGVGGMAGALAVDLVQAAGGGVPISYGLVFLVEASLFVGAAVIACRIDIATKRAAIDRAHRPSPALAPAE